VASRSKVLQHGSFPAFFTHLEFDLAEQGWQHHSKITGASYSCLMIMITGRAT
jgi:hypothetical protein